MPISFSKKEHLFPRVKDCFLIINVANKYIHIYCYMYIYTYGYMVTYVCIPYNSRCANYSFHTYIHTQGIKSPYWL